VAQDFKRNTALITGASQGIGRDLARQYARDGYQLILVARNETKLNELADELSKQHQTKSIVIAQDLAKPDSAQLIFEKTHRENISVDLLINNAGFGYLGDFAGSDLSIYLEMIQVNVTSLTYLTHLFLPEMIKRKSGRILNVASTAAFQPGPFMAVYYASKAYVMSFSLGLREELEGTGVEVSVLCPGPTITGFQNRARIADSHLFKRMSGIPSEAVASAAIDGLKRNKPLIIPGILNKMGVVGTRIMPRTWLAKTVRFLHGKIPKA
jgi:uncharacterized protein